MATNSLNTEVIQAAIEGFEMQKGRIDAQIAKLRQMLAGSKPEVSDSSAGRRKMSPAPRKRMAEGQRKRWAASKGNGAPAKAAAKPKRKLSEEGRAAIIAALKKRWAAKKVVAKKTAKQAGAQKVAKKAA